MKRKSYKQSEAIARQYAKTYRRKCERAAQFVRVTLAKELDKLGIKYASSIRAKEETSLARKLRRLRRTKLPLPRLVPLVGTDRDPNRVKDLAGARVSLYFPSDWALVEGRIFALFKNVTVKKHPGNVKGRPSRKRFDGYAARHYYIDSRENLRVELQVASALTHAWTEVEHDLVYKPGRKSLEANELAILDGLNGITTAGEALLDGLKLRLLERRVIKEPDSARSGIAQFVLRRSKNEFIAIGQNLSSLLVGKRVRPQRQFQTMLLKRLARQKELKATIIVADPRHAEQMSDLAYGFPLFIQDLKRAIAALKAFQARAVKAGVGGRLRVGTSRSVETTTLFLTDPRLASGLAYCTYTQLGSRPERRTPIKISRRNHPIHFAELYEDYACRCIRTMAPL